MLKMFSEKGGYTLDVIEKERYDQIVISSTYIRDVLSQGNVTLAAELLGYRYGVTGIVRHGRQLGRTLGFPTMNVEPEEKKILPRFGVYVCRINTTGVYMAEPIADITAVIFTSVLFTFQFKKALAEIQN